jgi:hypothetical protein
MRKKKLDGDLLAGHFKHLLGPVRQLLADVLDDPLLELAALEPLGADQYIALAARRLRRNVQHIIPQRHLRAPHKFTRDSAQPMTRCLKDQTQTKGKAKSHPGKKKIYPEVVAEGNVVEHHDVVNARVALYV